MRLNLVLGLALVVLFSALNTAFGQKLDLQVKDGAIISWTNGFNDVTLQKSIDDKHALYKVEFLKQISALGDLAGVGSTEFVIKTDTRKLQEMPSYPYLGQYLSGRTGPLRHDRVLVRDGSHEDTGLPQVRFLKLDDLKESHPQIAEFTPKKGAPFFAIVLRKKGSKILIYDPINDIFSEARTSLFEKESKTRAIELSKQEMSDEQSSLLQRWESEQGKRR